MGILENFLKLVSIDSPSDEDSKSCPSTEIQHNVADYIVKTLKDIGLCNVREKNGYVYGELTATKGYEDRPKIGFISHMDTAPDFNGFGVKPQIIENYDGERVLLNGSGHYLDPKDFPEILTFKGQTLITTDGTTLLGADDKAGIAEILHAVETVQKQGIAHGTVCVAFTPDEEIGRGADLFDVDGFGADFAYTVDGGLAGEIEYQNFNAANAQIVFEGVSIHPGSAKGKMVNSQYIAMEFANLLPVFERPEHTEGTEGFFHLISSRGSTEKTTLQYIIRDHDSEKFSAKKQMIENITAFINEKYGQGTAKATIKDSYYNMERKILPVFHLVDNADKAISSVGLIPKHIPIRGGTDGARLSFMGLPCPNLATGGANFHGRYECISLQSMEKCSQVVVELIKIYSKN